MNVNPEETLLWRAAFADQHCETATQTHARDELLVALRNLDRYVADLLSKIPEDCKGLTLHDITHVHQLWDVASVLCGSGYPINPAEGFVLGAAFLIHDAGLTAAAYPDGLPGIKASRLYRDLVSNGLKRADPDRIIEAGDIDNAPKDIAELALFDFLRLDHAERAAKLLDQNYTHPTMGTSFTLVPADMLFDFGEIIGNVAASHHWDIKRVDRTFSAPVPPPAAYPGWTFDAVKLACILRAADACAIDERRARTMSFIIENPRGISRSHWAFQKYLNPGYLPENAEALVFTSKRALPRAEMDAWWVAFDAIAVADRELRACGRLLKQDGVWPYGASTVVELKLDNSQWFSQFASYAARERGEADEISDEDRRYWRYFTVTVQMLVFALDVQIFLTCPFKLVIANKVDVFHLESKDFIYEWNLVFGDRIEGLGSRGSNHL